MYMYIRTNLDALEITVIIVPVNITSPRSVSVALNGVARILYPFGEINTQDLGVQAITHETMS